MGLVFIILGGIFYGWRQPKYDGPRIYLGLKQHPDPMAYSIVETYQTLKGKSQFLGIESNWSSPFPSKLSEFIIHHGSIPLVNWLPYDQDDPIPVQLKEIRNGIWDDHIVKWATAVKQLEYPVFMVWGAKNTDSHSPWSLLRYAKAPEEFNETYTYIMELFKEQGASNVYWVFDIDLKQDLPWTWDMVYRACPKAVQWVNVSVHFSDNAGLNMLEKANWQSLDALEKPLMLTVISDTYPKSLLSDFKSGLEAQWKPIQAIILQTKKFDSDAFEPLLKQSEFKAKADQIQSIKAIPFTSPEKKQAKLEEAQSQDFSLSVRLQKKDHSLGITFSVVDDIFETGLNGDRFVIQCEHPFQTMSFLVYESEVGYLIADQKTNRPLGNLKLTKAPTLGGYELSGEIPLSMIPAFVYNALTVTVTPFDCDNTKEQKIVSQKIDLPKIF